MNKMVEIAERCERLEPDWGEIHRLNSDIHDTIPGIKTVEPPDYCHSLDAAMTLVPEGWRWIMREAQPDKANPNERGFFARLETRDFESVTWGKGSDWLTDVIAGQDVFCWAATPALALCAAALRARSTLQSGKGQ